MLWCILVQQFIEAWSVTSENRSRNIWSWSVRWSKHFKLTVEYQRLCSNWPQGYYDTYSIRFFSSRSTKIAALVTVAHRKIVQNLRCSTFTSIANIERHGSSSPEHQPPFIMESWILQSVRLDCQHCKLQVRPGLITSTSTSTRTQYYTFTVIQFQMLVIWF